MPDIDRLRKEVHKRLEEMGFSDREIFEIEGELSVEDAKFIAEIGSKVRGGKLFLKEDGRSRWLPNQKRPNFNITNPVRSKAWNRTKIGEEEEE